MNGGLLQIYRIHIPVNSGSGAAPGSGHTFLGDHTQILESYAEREVWARPTFINGAGDSATINSAFDGGYVGGVTTVSNAVQNATAFDPYQFVGGYVQAGSFVAATHAPGTIAFQGAWIDGDTILRVNAAALDNATIAFSGYNWIGLAQLDSPATLMHGVLDVQTHNEFSGNALYGTGTLDAGRGQVLYPTSATLLGTVSVTNGSPSITFSQAQTIANGTVVTFASQVANYTISGTITNSTSGTLTGNYTGTTAGATTTTTNWSAGQTFYISGGLKIANSTTACLGISTVATPTLTCNKTISTTNIDTDLNATLGCYWVEGAGSFCNSGL
jgi:hypothetical protein